MAGEETILGSVLGASALTGLFMGAMLWVGIILILAIYVYSALYLSTVARKLGYKNWWLAWIPIANYFLYPILADKHWAYGFFLLIPLVNIIFYFIWTWRIFEKRKYPGWLCLIYILAFIPVINFIGYLANYIIWGFVAWADKK